MSSVVPSFRFEIITSRPMPTDRCSEDTPFLERSVEELGWIKSNSCLLIVGITGSNFIECLLKRYPKLRIIAADKQPRIVEMARCNNSRDNVTYCIADIEKRETLEYWLGTARKILSYHNLERVTDVKIAFKNFYDLLVPGGTAAVRLTLKNPVFSWMKEIFHRWRQFTSDLDAKSLPQPKEEGFDFSYQNILRSIGFEILYFRIEDGYQNFKSDLQCKKSLVSCCQPLFNLLPDRIKSGFEDDMFNRFAKYSTRNEHGDIVVHYTALEIFLKKPKLL